MDGSSTIGKRSLDEGILVAKAALRGEHREIDVLFLLNEAHKVFVIVLLSALKIFLGLSLVSAKK